MGRLLEVILKHGEIEFTLSMGMMLPLFLMARRQRLLDFKHHPAHHKERLLVKLDLKWHVMHLCLEFHHITVVLVIKRSYTRNFLFLVLVHKTLMSKPI